MTEGELFAKYKNAGIIKGSLHKGKGKHRGKNVVQCKCGACGTVQPVASSDLWLKLCSNPKCGEKLNRGRNARKRGAKWWRKTTQFAKYAIRSAW